MVYSRPSSLAGTARATMAVPEDPPSMGNRISPSSTAPRSTVTGSEETNHDEECAQYFPRGNKSAIGDGDVCSPSPVVLSAKNDHHNPKGRREPTTVSAVIEPGIFMRRNAQIEVEAGSAVQWVRHGAGDSAIPPTDNAQRVSESSGHHGQTGPQPASGTGDNGLFVTIVSEDTDEPPVTRQVPGEGLCFHDLFDRPGRYTYYVCSSSVITGCIISKATASQPCVVEPAIATFPAIPSKSVVIGNGSVSHMSRKGMRIPQMATVPSDEGTTTVEGLGSSLGNKQLRHQQECKHNEPRGRGYEGDGLLGPLLVPSAALMKSKTVHLPMPLNGATSKRIPGDMIDAGGDQVCVSETGETVGSSEIITASPEPPSQKTVEYLTLTDDGVSGTISIALKSKANGVAHAYVEERPNIAGLPGRSPKSVVPLVPKADYPDASSQNTESSPPPEAYAAPGSISALEDSNPASGNDVGLNGAAAEKPERGREGILPTAAGTMLDTGSSKVEIVNTNPLDDTNAPDVIAAMDERDATMEPWTEQGTVRYNVAGLVTPDVTFANEANETDMLMAQKPKSDEQASSTTSLHRLQSVTASHFQKADHGPATYDRSGTKSPARVAVEKIWLVSEPAAGENVAQGTDNFLLSRLSQPVVPSDNSEAFFAQDCGKGYGSGGGEPSSVDSDDLPVESWIEGSADSDNSVIGQAKQPPPSQSPLVRSPSVPVAITIPNEEGGGGIIAQVVVRLSSSPREEPDLCRNVDGIQGEPGRELEGASPFKIGGTDSLPSRRSVDNDGTPRDESPKATVCGGNTEENVMTSSQEEMEPKLTRMEPTAEGVRDKLKEDSSGKTKNTHESASLTATTFTGSAENSKEALGKGDGPATSAPSTCDVPSSFPRSTSEHGIPHKRNNKDYAFESEESPRTSKVAASRGKPFGLDTGTALRKRQGKGKASSDGKSNATASTQDDGGEQEGAVATMAPPKEEEKDRPSPTKFPKSMKGNNKNEKEVFGSGAENGGVVSRCDGWISVVKHGAAVMLGEEGTYARKFGDCGVGKEPVKTLLVSDRGFKPAKHLILEVESIVSVKTTSDCTRAGNEHQSIYVVGPIAQKNRRSYDGSKKKDLERTPTHTVTSEVPLEVVLMKPGEYWLVENFSGKRIRVTATPRELPEVPGSDCEQHTADSSQYAASLSARTSSTEMAKKNTDGAKGRVTFSCSKNDKEDKGNARAAAAPFSETTSTPAADAKNTVREAKAATSAQFADSTSYDSPREQAREGTSPKLSSRIPPVRVMGEGQRISGDEYDSFNARFAAAVVQVSHPKGFDLPKLQLGFAPGLGTLVVCELGARQRVTREVVCRYIACESMNREATRQRSKGGRESTPAATEERPREIVAKSRVETNKDHTASVRLGPGTLSVCSFILGRFGNYRLSFRNDVSAGLTVVVCPPRNALSPMTSVDPPSLDWPTRGEGMKEMHDRSPQKDKQGWWSGEYSRNGTGKRLSQQTPRGGRGIDSLTQVCGRDSTVLSSSWQPSVDTRAIMKTPAAKPSTQGQQKSGTTEGPGSKVKANCVSWTKVTAEYGKQPPIQCSSIQWRSQVQHDVKSQVIKKQRSNKTDTSSTSALLGEAISDEKTKKNQVATHTAPVASTKALKIPPAKMHQDDMSAPCSSTKGTSKITSTENLATATKEVSSAVVGEVSTLGEPLDTTKFPVSTSIPQERWGTLGKTPDESRGPRNRSKLSAAMPSEDRGSGRSKLGAVTQSDYGQITVSASEKLVDDSTAVGSTTATSQEEEPTGWPTPIEGASWSQECVKPMACAGDGPQVERCGRSGTMSDTPTASARESVGVHSSSIGESCSTRGGPGQPRSRRPRSPPLNLASEKCMTPTDVTVSRCQPWSQSHSESIHSQRDPEKVDSLAQVCSAWGHVSPSASSRNDGGWPSVPSAPASVKPTTSPCNVTEPVGSESRKAVDPLHTCKERQKDSAPYQAQGKKTAVSVSSRTSKGLVPAADSTSSTSLNKTIGKKDKAAPAVKAVVMITSAGNAPTPLLSEDTEWSSTSGSTAAGAGKRGAIGQRQTDRKCSPNIDPQISFGDFVPPGKEATSLIARTATVPSPAQGGNSLSSSTDLCGWTTTVEDCDRTKSLGKTMSKLEGGRGSFEDSTGAVRRTSKGGWGEETTTSASAGTSPFLSADSGGKPLRSSSGVQPAVKDLNRALVGVSASDCLANPNPATTAPAAGDTVSMCRVASTKGSADHKGPRWGNYSTKISLAERVRRSEQLNDICLPNGYRPDEPVKSRPAAFPETCRRPNGNGWVPEDEGDTLPPPSEYEKAETAIMMKLYNDIMERLHTSGYDKKLSNGHRPKIYDLTVRPEL